MDGTKIARVAHRIITGAAAAATTIVALGSIGCTVVTALYNHKEDLVRQSEPDWFKAVIYTYVLLGSNLLTWTVDFIYVSITTCNNPFVFVLPALAKMQVPGFDDKRQAKPLHRKNRKEWRAIGVLCVTLLLSAASLLVIAIAPMVDNTRSDAKFSLHWQQQAVFVPKANSTGKFNVTALACESNASLYVSVFSKLPPLVEENQQRMITQYEVADDKRLEVYFELATSGNLTAECQAEEPLEYELLTRHPSHTVETHTGKTWAVNYSGSNGHIIQAKLPKPTNLSKVLLNCSITTRALKYDTTQHLKEQCLVEPQEPIIDHQHFVMNDTDVAIVHSNASSELWYYWADVHITEDLATYWFGTYKDGLLALTLLLIAYLTMAVLIFASCMTMAQIGTEQLHNTSMLQKAISKPFDLCNVHKVVLVASMLSTGLAGLAISGLQLDAPVQTDNDPKQEQNTLGRLLFWSCVLCVAVIWATTSLYKKFTHRRNDRHAEINEQHQEAATEEINDKSTCSAPEVFLFFALACAWCGFSFFYPL